MRRILFASTAMLFFVLTFQGGFAQPVVEIGNPISFVGGCEADLDKDGDQDSALLIHTSRGYELIVILRSDQGAKSYVLNRSDAGRRLACKYGTEIKETGAGPDKGERRTFKIDGAYVTLLQPESSEVAYFWTAGDFKEVRLSD